MGTKFREFKRSTCASFKTYELPKERAKRQRAKAKKEKLTKSAQLKEADTEVDTVSAQGQDEPSWKEKTFNLETYKYHALADYAATIKTYGTTDSYSTESVSPSSAFLLVLLGF
jgi:hypothetical protein